MRVCKELKERYKRERTFPEQDITYDEKLSTSFPNRQCMKQKHTSTFITKKSKTQAPAEKDMLVVFWNP